MKMLLFDQGNQTVGSQVNIGGADKGYSSNDQVWRKLDMEEGYGYEVIQGPYRGRYETCLCTDESVFRNRKWMVWMEDGAIKGVLASGYFYGSSKAEQMILKALELGL